MSWLLIFLWRGRAPVDAAAEGRAGKGCACDGVGGHRSRTDLAYVRRDAPVEEALDYLRNRRPTGQPRCSAELVVAPDLAAAVRATHDVLIKRWPVWKQERVATAIRARESNVLDLV